MAGKVTMKLLYENDDGVYDITEIVTGISGEGDMSKAYRSLDINVMNTEDGRTRRFNIEEGREIKYFVNDEEWFRGVIFSTDGDESGAQSIKAYDFNVFLTKSSDDRKFRNVTASGIARELCRDFGVPVNVIRDTSYVIPKLYFTDGKTLYDMILTAITETEKQTGTRYYLSNEKGGVTLRKRGEVSAEWVIENGSNLTGASYKRDIEDLRSQVKVVAGDEDNPISITVRSDKLIERFGIMQHYESSTGDTSRSQAQQRANQLLKDLGTIADEAKVVALGIPSVIAGTSVYVREDMTGIKGAYYVSSDKHEFAADGTHTMSLTLSATDDLPKLEYENKDEGGA